MPQSLPLLLGILDADKMGVGPAVDAKLPESLVLRYKNTSCQIAEWAFALHQRPVEPHVEDWSVDATDPHDCPPEHCEAFA